MLNPMNMSHSGGAGRGGRGRGRGILGQYYPPGANMPPQNYGVGYLGDGGGYASGGGYPNQGSLDRQQETQLLQLLKRQSDVIERLSEQVGLDQMPIAPAFPGNRQTHFGRGAGGSTGVNFGQYGNQSQFGNHGNYSGFHDDYNQYQDYQYMDMGYSGNYHDYQDYGMHGYSRGGGGRRGGYRQGNQDRQQGQGNAVSESRNLFGLRTMYPPANVPTQSKKTKKGKAGYPMKLPLDIDPSQYEDSYTYFCHACSYQCTNNADRKNHNKGQKHLKRMEEVNRMPKNKAQPILDKIALVKALRDKEKTLMSCVVCDADLTVPYSDHKNQNQHKNRSRQVKAGCGCCKSGPFKNFTELKDHRLKEEHKTNAEKAREKIEAEIEKCTDESSFPPFEEGTAIGQSYIEKVEGYYCTLCKKFFMMELEAKIEHCGVKAHYNKVKLQKVKPEEDESSKSDSATSNDKDCQNKDAKSSSIVERSS